jgi:hypothetical protein
LNSTYLIIDALDECVTDLPKLLDCIVQKSSVSPLVNWIVSSRNDTNIERGLRLDNSGTRLSLELKENAKQVSRAVNAYIDHYLSELTEIQHNKLLRKMSDHFCYLRWKSAYIHEGTQGLLPGWRAPPPYLCGT